VKSTIEIVSSGLNERVKESKRTLKGKTNEDDDGRRKTDLKGRHRRTDTQIVTSADKSRAIDSNGSDNSCESMIRSR
jgi:hypothetical protein